MGGEDRGARSGLGDARRRSETQRRGLKALAKVSAAMATVFPPERARERGGGEWTGAE